MKASNSDLWAVPFSHIYIEKQAAQDQLTHKILSHFTQAHIVEITSYKEVFNRKKQDYREQQHSPTLILAHQQPPYLYPGSHLCQGFSEHTSYYTTNMLNCVFQCGYCFLKGMYETANVVIYTNPHDVFDFIEQNITDNIYIHASYETDLLAFERYTGFCGMWIEYVAHHSNIHVELRTKSSNAKELLQYTSHPHVVLAWSLSPHDIQKKYEYKTASLQKRLAAIKQVIAHGWQVRLCFDPILWFPEWEQMYESFFSHVFSEIQPDMIYDVSIGTFRIPTAYLKAMRHADPTNELLSTPFESISGTSSYTKPIQEMLMQRLSRQLLQYLDSKRIIIWK